MYMRARAGVERVIARSLERERERERAREREKERAREREREREKDGQTDLTVKPSLELIVTATDIIQVAFLNAAPVMSKELLHHMLPEIGLAKAVDQVLQAFAAQFITRDGEGGAELSEEPACGAGWHFPDAEEAGHMYTYTPHLQHTYTTPATHIHYTICTHILCTHVLHLAGIS